MLCAIVLLVRDRGVTNGLLWLKQTQLHARDEKTHQTNIHLTLVEQSLSHRLRKVLIGATAIEVATHLDSESSGLFARGRYMVAFMKVFDGPAVTDDKPFKAPVFAQEFNEQSLTGAAGLTIGAIVRSHDAVSFGLRDASMKRREVGFP